VNFVEQNRRVDFEGTVTAIQSKNASVTFESERFDLDQAFDSTTGSWSRTYGSDPFSELERSVYTMGLRSGSGATLGLADLNADQAAELAATGMVTIGDRDYLLDDFLANQGILGVSIGGDQRGIFDGALFDAGGSDFSLRLNQNRVLIARDEGEFLHDGISHRSRPRDPGIRSCGSWITATSFSRTPRVTCSIPKT
jgi:hypothetical protein